MVRALARWLMTSVVLLFVVTALTFVLSQLAPGDAAKTILGGLNTTYTPTQLHELQHQLGIDQPLPVQYWHWLDHLLHGNLGTDLFSGQPIIQALNARLGATLSIIIATVIVSGVVGVAVGTFSAVRGGFAARIIDMVSLFGLAMPNFWLALVLTDLLAVQVQLFPATGYTPITQDPVQWLRSIALPVLALSAGASAIIGRQTRDAMADVLARDYITALRSRGLPLRSVVFKHALRNAAIPVITLLGLLFVGLLGGTVLIESVYSVPGMGQEAVTASSSHNLPLIEGIALYFTVIVVIVNLLVEVSYRLLNPAVQTS